MVNFNAFLHTKYQNFAWVHSYFWSSFHYRNVVVIPEKIKHNGAKTPYLKTTNTLKFPQDVHECNWLLCLKSKVFVTGWESMMVWYNENVKDGVHLPETVGL